MSEPMHESPTGPGFDELHPILLVATPWRARTYILAELQERGYEVRALPGIHHALGYLIRRPAVQPVLVVLDTTGDPDLGPETARDLFEMTAPAPWVVITSAVHENLPEEMTASPRVHVLRRPVTVGDVVAKIVELLQQVADESSATH